MLVFSRKIGESFVIGHNIRVTILEMPTRGKVRVGIEAPPEVPVHRQEIYDQLHGKGDGNAQSQHPAK